MAFNGDKHLKNAFIELRDQYKIKSVIETGTYYADTTKWLSANFENVYTCELKEDTYAKAVESMKELNNVHHALEDSRTWLPKTLDTAISPFIVFLDAHWFENPLLVEIDAIGKSGKRPILIIHDFQVPGKDFGFDSYDHIVYNWDYVKEAVEKAYDNKFVKYYNEQATGAKRGVVFILPTS